MENKKNKKKVREIQEAVKINLQNLLSLKDKLERDTK